MTDSVSMSSSLDFYSIVNSVCLRLSHSDRFRLLHLKSSHARCDQENAEQTQTQDQSHLEIVRKGSSGCDRSRIGSRCAARIVRSRISRRQRGGRKDGGYVATSNLSFQGSFSPARTSIIAHAMTLPVERIADELYSHSFEHFRSRFTDRSRWTVSASQGLPAVAASSHGDVVSLHNLASIPSSPFPRLHSLVCAHQLF